MGSARVIADWAGDSKTPPPPSQPPSRPPVTVPSRPPTKPPNKATHPTPDPEPPPPPPAPFDDIFAVAASLGFGDLQSPGRQSDRSHGGHPLAGGPVKPSVAAEKEPTPGSAVAVPAAARGSTGVVAGAGAAFRSEGGRAGGASPAPGAVSGLASGGVIRKTDRLFVVGENPPGFVLPPMPRLRPFVATAPDPHPPGPIDPPIPHPPPPVRLGEGALYDPLIGRS